MKFISDLQNNPAVLLTLVIAITGISIIVVLIIVIYRLQYEKKVTNAAVELKRITNSIRAGLVHFVLEDNCRILYASQGFYEVLGYGKEDIKEDNRRTLLDFLDPGSRDFVSEIERQINNETICTEVVMLKKDGERIYLLMNGNSTAGKDGKHTLSVVFVDISEMKRMQELILLDGERYRIATELSNDVIFEYDIKADRMVYTDKFKDLFGLDPIFSGYRKNSAKRKYLIHPDDWGIYLEFCQELGEGKSIIEAQYRIKNQIGKFIWCQIMGKTIYDDQKAPVRVIGKIVNVDTQKRELEALEYKATRDPLTGIYNKEVTIKKIDQYILGNKENIHMLMFLDLDDFKGVNDTYGHLAGDKVLVHIINHIKETFTDGEIIGRIGGDEFVIFAGNITGPEEIKEKAAKLKTALETANYNSEVALRISGSIGVAVYPEAGTNYEHLIAHADRALYKVKANGKNDYLLYSEDI